MSAPPSQESQKITPAQPAKIFFCVLAGTCMFYLIDCVMVTLFQDHPDSPWIEWGIHARGPAGFGITAIIFLVGIATWLKEMAKLIDKALK